MYRRGDIYMWTLSILAVMSLVADTVTSLSATVAPSKPSETIIPTQKLSRTGADMKAWANGFTNCPVEMPPTIIDMELPSDFPVGTFFRNGHGRFTADDGTPVIHPFDGDGMIVAMTFDPENNRVMFRNRFVETGKKIMNVLYSVQYRERDSSLTPPFFFLTQNPLESYIQDKTTGTMSARGLFGTRKSGGFWGNLFRTDYKHVGNTNVVHCGDSLYALWEGGKPYLLDPLTLQNKVCFMNTHCAFLL
jgi:all-trans-8'-apo-beta-carotenal 15,15'-oxygenase